MTKSKDLFLVEQLLKVFRQLVEAADPVGGHRDVDLLRVGQVQVVHDLKRRLTTWNRRISENSKPALAQAKLLANLTKYQP